MRKVYTCVDIGSHSTKIVVSEKINDRFVVLSRTIVKSKNVKKGIILNEEETLESLKQAFNKIEEELGIKIDNVICIVPSDNREISMSTGRVQIKEETIGKETITKVLQASTSGKISEDRMLVSVSPIAFSVNDKDNLKNVIGMTGSEIKVKTVITTIPKNNVRSIYLIFKKLGKNIVDICLSIVGDYYSTANSKMNEDTTAVIDIGYDKTEVGIFNKGILIKNEIIDIGSKIIDREISYIYNLEKKKARYIKETFAVSNTRYADVNDVVSITNKYDEIENINQLEVSEIVETNIREIIKLAKKQISILTNKEIRYIIVSGGISELAGFQYVLENAIGYNANVISLNEMGIRSNSYSSSFGAIKFFSKKLDDRGKSYSMIDANALDIMTKKHRKTTSESGFGNILNYFTGNKEE